MCLSSVKIMLSANVEQRVNIKFLTKLGKSVTETYSLLTEVYGDQCLSRTQVFEWFKKFKEGRKHVGDDPKSGHPSTANTQENVEKVARIVRGDRRLSIRAISELTNINKESVRQILHDDLGMKKVCAKVVPKILTPEQKEYRVNCCADTLMSKSKFKAIMIVFFDIWGVIYIDWVPEGQTVNQVYYKNVLTTLCERVR